MPFIGKELTTGSRIDISTIAEPRKKYKLGDCICPLCETVFIIKAGLLTAPHFAHKAACTSGIASHPESAEHRSAKLFLRDTLPRDVPEYQDAKVDLEVPIWEVRRIADVLVTLTSGWQIAHEVQLASITTQELEERTYDYNRAGIDVVWWLGGRAASNANESWSFENYGYCLNLDFRSGTISRTLLGKA